ncbi:hypothetical protein [Methylocystis parvus]|uniref:hypothetical protein n=1 Tax=Methylocystis parvus TaxID=134 RepID=UPI003C710063
MKRLEADQRQKTSRHWMRSALTAIAAISETRVSKLSTGSLTRCVFRLDRRMLRLPWPEARSIENQGVCRLIATL